MTVGERIKATREVKGITQSELAKAAHTTKQTIFKYESGIVTNIPYEKMIAISNRLGVTGRYLMGWEPFSAADDFSPEEIELIHAFREADEIDQEAVRRMLGVSGKNNELSEVSA